MYGWTWSGPCGQLRKYALQVMAVPFQEHLVFSSTAFLSFHIWPKRFHVGLSYLSMPQLSYQVAVVLFPHQKSPEII